MNPTDTLVADIMDVLADANPAPGNAIEALSRALAFTLIELIGDEAEVLRLILEGMPHIVAEEKKHSNSLPGAAPHNGPKPDQPPKSFH